MSNDQNDKDERRGMECRVLKMEYVDNKIQYMVWDEQRGERE